MAIWTGGHVDSWPDLVDRWLKGYTIYGRTRDRPPGPSPWWTGGQTCWKGGQMARLGGQVARTGVQMARIGRLVARWTDLLGQDS